MKAAKVRRGLGQPPQPLEAAVEAEQEVEGATRSGATPLHASQPTSPRALVGKGSESTTPKAARAMLTVLQILPEGSKLGYKTCEGFFVPLNVNNLQVEHGAAERLAEAPPAVSYRGALPPSVCPRCLVLLQASLINTRLQAMVTGFMERWFGTCLLGRGAPMASDKAAVARYRRCCEDPLSVCIG